MGKADRTFYCVKYNVTNEDISVQVIHYCDPNDQEREEDFWVYHLDKLHTKGLKPFLFDWKRGKPRCYRNVYV